MTPLMQKMAEDKELEKNFNYWVDTFEIRDGVRGKPSWFSLVHSIQFALEGFLKEEE